MDKNFTLIEFVHVLALAVLGTLVFAMVYLRFGVKPSLRRLLGPVRRKQSRATSS